MDTSVVLTLCVLLAICPFGGSKCVRRNCVPKNIPMSIEKNCECGISAVKTRIINGEAVKPPYKYPWMVGIKNHDTLSCTGTLITLRHGLSAAHCFTEKPRTKRGKYSALPISAFKVALVDKSRILRGYVSLKKIVIHPQFDFPGLKFDIALFTLKKPVRCTSQNRPICLPTITAVMTRSAVISGWGYTSTKGGKASKVQGENSNGILMEGKANVLSQAECKREGADKGPSYFCAKGNQAVCYGDSGGPLKVQVQGKYYILGVVSHGFDLSCDIKHAQNFSNVTYYLPWIKKNIR